MKSHLCATLVLILAATTGGNAQAADYVFAKANITGAIHRADDDLCWKVARGEPVDVSGATSMALGQMAMTQIIPPAPQISSGANLLGGFIGGIIATKVDIAKAQKHFHMKCMKGAGYVYARLTPKETRAYLRKSTALRRVWVDTFLQSERAVEATRPLVPKLPENRPGPTFAIVKDSASLAEGPKNLGEDLITAKAQVHVVRLKTPIAYDDGVGVKVTVAPGQIFLSSRLNVFIDIINNTPFREEEPAWCAPAVVAKSKVQNSICLLNGNDGYRVALNGSGQLKSTLLTTPLEFEEAELAPVDVRYSTRQLAFQKDLVAGNATVDGSPYLVGQNMSGKDGTIALPVGEEVFVVTPTGTGKTRTYTVARQKP